MRTLLSGFDDRGKVYDLGDVIERTIDDAYRDSVASLHRIFKERRLAEKGIVETELRGDGRLEHRKLVTSYPYEWPASMYKDAALRRAADIAPLDPEQTALARRYAYWYFVQRHILINVIDSEQGHWGDPDIRRMDELLPGRDPVMDTVCRNIVEGKDVVLP